ncbi:MAG TPA: hypothetical protein VE685_12985, partial [Thermoanaerobaculia bacterium]|nr:hypothetical protein [Thermoanaerobaculia bacterium]
RELTEWWQGISGGEKGQLAQELSQALLEIQKQRIVAALEKVEAEYRQELGLSFLLHKEISLTDKGRLVGDHQLFQQACKATAQAFRSEESRAGELAKLYRRVLEVAELADDGSSGSQAPIPGARTIGDSLRARNGWISLENRRFLQQRLQQILAELHREVLRLGRRVIVAALEHYSKLTLDELYQHNPEIQKLKEAIVRAQGTNTAPFEEALLRRLYEQIRIDFKGQGYELLPEAWGSV